MRYAKQILSCWWSRRILCSGSCGQKTNCNGISFGTAGSAAVPRAAASAAEARSAVPGSNNSAARQDYFFYHGSSGANNALNTASLTASTFQYCLGISTPVGQSIVGSMIIVNKKFLYLP